MLLLGFFFFFLDVMVWVFDLLVVVIDQVIDGLLLLILHLVKGLLFLASLSLAFSMFASKLHHHLLKSAKVIKRLTI